MTETLQPDHEHETFRRHRGPSEGDEHHDPFGRVENLDFAGLFDKNEVTLPDVGPDSNLTAAGESVRDQRLSELFKPVLVAAEDDYDLDPEALSSFFAKLEQGVDPTEALQEHDESQPEETIAKRGEREIAQEPSDDQKLEAFSRLVDAENADPYIKALIVDFMPDRPGKTDGTIDYVAVTDSIRTNPDLRYALGSYFLRDKLPFIAQTQPHALPRRIAVNEDKRPGARGYDHISNLKSREYSAMLALAMLDGTFNSEDATSYPIEIGADKRVIRGQHRAAALLLLGRAEVSLAA